MKAKNVQEVIAVFEAQIAELKACADNGWILAYDNGLGVRFPEPGKPAVCGLEQAEVVAYDNMPEDAWAFIPNVINGNGEKAKVVRRQAAIKAEIAKLEGYVADFKAAA